MASSIFLFIYFFFYLFFFYNELAQIFYKDTSPSDFSFLFVIPIKLFHRLYCPLWYMTNHDQSYTIVITMLWA